MSNYSYAIIVDDKIAPLAWGVQALRLMGFDDDKIVVARYGDEAMCRYKELLDRGEKVNIILSDYHMDVRRKPPEGIMGSFKRATIFSGIELAQAIRSINPEQKFCMVTSGLRQSVFDEIGDQVDFVLYKRRPEDKKFLSYVETIKAYIDGDESFSEKYAAVLPYYLSRESLLGRVNAVVNSHHQCDGNAKANHHL